ncbi:MAG: hypothetical protein R2761_11995 [Acidimicrobiales bacterium]
MTEPGRLFDPDEPPPLQPDPAGPAVVRVLPDVSGLDKEFDYLPVGGGAPPPVGSLVRVQLQRRTVAGWVTASGVTPPAGVSPQPLVKVTSAGPSPELVDLARWAAHRWSGRLAPVLRAASPPRQVPLLGDAEPASRGAREAGVTLVRLAPDDDGLSLIEPLARRGSVLVITPRLGAAGHLAGRLRRLGLGARVHPRDWPTAAARGGVVVGARSTVWARVPDLAGIVVLDEHDESLQEERNPTWHARDVAVERARRAGVPCVLASPCPSLAALALAGDELRTPSRSAERAGWPVVELVDRRREEPGRSGLFSSRVAAVVRAPGPVLCVLNRKGRAVMLSCGVCGELVRTEDREHLMVEQDGQLVSPATGETRPLVCAVCGAAKLKRLRLGVTRAAEELSALAGEPVAELTAGTSPARLPARVLVGTEAALHQLGGVATVVFLDIDAELLAPRYRAGEQAMALLVHAARLAGPRAGGGRIVVQTRTPEHRVLRAAVHADPGVMAREEATVRRAMGLPPYGALAEVSGAGADALVERLLADPGLAVMGPRDGRWLIRADTPDHLADALRPDRRPPGRLRVHVDPPRV